MCIESFCSWLARKEDEGFNQPPELVCSSLYQHISYSLLKEGRQKGMREGRKGGRLASTDMQHTYFLSFYHRLEKIRPYVSQPHCQTMCKLKSLGSAEEGVMLMRRPKSEFSSRVEPVGFVPRLIIRKWRKNVLCLCAYFVYKRYTFARTKRVSFIMFWSLLLCNYIKYLESYF